MVRTPELGPQDPPILWRVNPDGSASKGLHLALPPAADPVPVKHYRHVSDCNFTFEYLDMKPGELLIFSKRTMYMSDPRLVLRNLPANRLAMNIRIVLHDD